MQQNRPAGRTYSVPSNPSDGLTEVGQEAQERREGRARREGKRGEKREGKGNGRRDM